MPDLSGIFGRSYKLCTKTIIIISLPLQVFVGIIDNVRTDGVNIIIIGDRKEVICRNPAVMITI